METLDFQMDGAKRLCRNSAILRPGFHLRVPYGLFFRVLRLDGQFCIQISHHNLQPLISSHARRRDTCPRFKLGVSHKIRSRDASQNIASKEAVGNA